MDEKIKNLSGIQLLFNDCFTFINCSYHYCYQLLVSLRRHLFEVAYRLPAGLSSLWLILYNTIFHTGCCEALLNLLHVVVVDGNTGLLRYLNKTLETKATCKSSIQKPPKSSMLLIEMAVLGQDFILEAGSRLAPHIDFITPVLTDEQLRRQKEQEKQKQVQQQERQRQQQERDEEEREKKKQEEIKLILQKEQQERILIYDQNFSTHEVLGLDLHVWDKQTQQGVYVRSVFPNSQASVGGSGGSGGSSGSSGSS